MDVRSRSLGRLPALWAHSEAFCEAAPESRSWLPNSHEFRPVCSPTAPLSRTKAWFSVRCRCRRWHARWAPALRRTARTDCRAIAPPIYHSVYRSVARWSSSRTGRVTDSATRCTLPRPFACAHSGSAAVAGCAQSIRCSRPSGQAETGVERRTCAPGHAVTGRRSAHFGSSS